MAKRRAFTLVELLVVILIILAISVLTLPTILSANRARATGEAARLIQGTLVGARDAAIGSGQPRGIRLVPDPSFPVSYLAAGGIDPATALAAGSIVATEIPPRYSDGLVNSFPGSVYAVTVTGGRPCLVLEESPGTWVSSGTAWVYQPNEPVNWWYVIRLGERITVASQVLTVCGPMVTGPAAGNAEMFANQGPPGTVSPISRTYTAPDGVTTATAAPQFLLLVNGRDDNNDGFADNGWDGLDNDAINGIDDLAEWENEAWPQTLLRPLVNAAYTIDRRPVPSPGQQSLAIPSSVIIDLTTWGTTRERSRLPVNPFTGAVDLLIAPDGSARPDLPYGVLSSVGMSAAFYHFWICDRSDVMTSGSGPGLLLPIPPTLAGGRYLVSLQSRTGRLSSWPLEMFDPTDAGAPFRSIQQGQ